MSAPGTTPGRGPRKVRGAITGSVRNGGKRPAPYDPYDLPHRLGYIFFLGSFIILVAGVINLGPDLSAAHGQGTRGTWVARTRVCGQQGCRWKGDFLLPDGKETRHDVEYDGSPPHIRAGLRVPALDTGDLDTVFPINGESESGGGDILAIVFGAIGTLIFVTRWTHRHRRRRPGRAHRAPARAGRRRVESGS